MKVAPIFLLLLVSCTPLAIKREGYVQGYREGCYEEAEAKITALMDESGPNEQVWLRLDRGSERLAAGDEEGAVEDFNVAIETMEDLSQKSFLEGCGQVLLSDASSPYRGDDFEQLLARIYFAFALLQQGDMSNAMALLRQAEEWSQAKADEYLRHPATESLHVPENPLGKYLFAVLLEKRGDKSNADILYRQSGIDRGSAGKCVILVVCHSGLAPYKYTEYCPASQMSALAFEMFMGGQRCGPALSTLVGIPVPALAHRPGATCPPLCVKVGCEEKRLCPAFRIEAAARAELEQKRPLILARGAARLALRRAAVWAAGEQNCQLGALVDLGMLITNCATQADTRSWSLLPERIDLARFDVDPGSHRFQHQDFSADLRLKKGDVAVIHLFHFYPGWTQVLIPHYQERI